MAQAHDLVDGLGVAFEQHRRLVPMNLGYFPPANIVRSYPVLASYRFNWLKCQICGRDLHTNDGHVHHIIGGSGKSDEETNLLRLCNGFGGCHDESWSIMLPQALWAKATTDREHLSWVRLAILLGHHLPDPKEPR